MSQIMNALKIVALCVAAAVAYGIVHDQITARICIEYFTIGHPRIVSTESPTVLGLVWGVVATWWVGFLLGVPLAFVSLRGPRPKRTARSLVRPLLVLLAVMGAVASVAGVIGYLTASNGIFVLVEPLATSVPEDRHVAFLTAGWAHSASYLVGFVGGIVLIWKVRRDRRMVHRTPSRVRASIRADMEAFKNRTVYTSLDPDTLASIPDDLLEQAVFDYADSCQGSMPEGARALYLTWIVESQVNNGGFNQYYWNSSGADAHEAVWAFEFFGAKDYAGVMREANAIRAAEANEIEPLQKRATLEAFSESYEISALDPLDDRFYALGDRLSELRIATIRDHPSRFSEVSD